MKFLKWLLFGFLGLVLVAGVGIVALVYLVDWNDFKDTIETQTKAQTGRELTIAGDLNPSVFPWVGISLGEISLANAQDFGDRPFAALSSADVKVELLPLLRRVVNIRTVELNGLSLDLQRAADGRTNWDDLLARQSTTTTTEEDTGTTKEVEGGSAAIAALAVGGIAIGNANIQWTDAQSGTDAALSGFNLTTGAIELEKPFDLSTDFSVVSNSMDLNAAIDGKTQVTLDLDNQTYILQGLNLSATAKGGALPGGELAATLGANVVANMVEQKVDVDGLSLAALGVELAGQVNVTDLNTTANVNGTLQSNEFSLRELFSQLGIEPPVTADETVLNKVSLSLSLAATPASAALNDLQIVLDDTTLSGEASVPSFAGAMPPVRFALAVDAIDLDRYLPPTPAETEGEAEQAPAETAPAEDVPIELPMQLIRDLDVDGTFSVGELKVANLATRDIVVPIKAAGGVAGIEGLSASLYEGKVAGMATVNAKSDLPVYTTSLSLDGVQAEPLLGDLLQDDSFLSGQGQFSTELTTRGASLNVLMAGLNGGFKSAFNDGSINGINIGYQLRRVQARLKGQGDPQEEQVKTDFSSLSVSGVFTDGVMSSDDLDLRSPLLRLGGAGTVSLPAETVDYTLTTLITGTTKGQGGADLQALKGVKLNVPIKGTFAALAADPAGVIFKGMRDGIKGNLKGLADKQAAEAKAKAKAEADRLKAQGEAELKKQLLEEQGELEAKAREEAKRAQDKLKDGLKGLLK